MCIQITWKTAEIQRTQLCRTWTSLGLGIPHWLSQCCRYTPRFENHCWPGWKLGLVPRQYHQGFSFSHCLHSPISVCVSLLRLFLHYMVRATRSSDHILPVHSDSREVSLDPSTQNSSFQGRTRNFSVPAFIPRSLGVDSEWSILGQVLTPSHRHMPTRKQGLGFSRPTSSPISRATGGRSAAIGSLTGTSGDREGIPGPERGKEGCWPQCCSKYIFPKPQD